MFACRSHLCMPSLPFQHNGSRKLIVAAAGLHLIVRASQYLRATTCTAQAKLTPLIYVVSGLNGRLSSTLPLCPSRCNPCWQAVKRRLCRQTMIATCSARPRIQR